MLWVLGIAAVGIVLSILLEKYLTRENARPDSEIEKRIDSARRMAEFRGEK